MRRYATMWRYATMRRYATLKHKVLSGGASWKYFGFLRRNVAKRRIYERIISNIIYFGINKNMSVVYNEKSQRTSTRKVHQVKT